MQGSTFLILAVLASEPMHGYGVIRAVQRLSHGDVVLRPGTLYGALDRLVDQGLVEVDREEAVDGRLRRYYRLTDGGYYRLTGGGAAALAVQLDRLCRHAVVLEARSGFPTARSSLARMASGVAR